MKSHSDHPWNDKADALAAKEKSTKKKADALAAKQKEKADALAAKEKELADTTLDIAVVDSGKGAAKVKGKLPLGAKKKDKTLAGAVVDSGKDAAKDKAARWERDVASPQKVVRKAQA